ncbi:hypothetical protein NECAME_05914 [Necator americanus]|uniref:Uncharacterized protein n=1 Tax=Necator americanus TaxID=51031 RepID=W2TWQ5_NECAM|nr:hypothetical protein NECAME_05914 [Necator americanus]ETN86510.1 hypothetical protein NECAME_05914 [Necator americanus]
MSQPPEYAAAAAALRSTPAQMAAAITIDLVIASQREANFLRMIDRKAPLLYEVDVVNQAIRRYETCWLPMQAAHPDMNVIPPLDVHWVWHTHMLSPLHYQEVSESIIFLFIYNSVRNFHAVLILLVLVLGFLVGGRYESSVRAWDTYCSPEPYDFLASPAASPSYKSTCGYDIAAAVQRQRNFNYQVSLPHYTSTKFLTEAVKRYIQFLLLKQTYSDQFLTPCYDFDIVWHTHQVHPHSYLRDCTAIFGSLLKHDDTVNDRTKGSKLLKGEALTKKLWATHFEEPFWRRGCMFSLLEVKERPQRSSFPRIRDARSVEHCLRRCTCSINSTKRYTRPEGTIKVSKNLLKTLLPPTNSKSAHNVAEVCLKSKDVEPEMSARVSVTTSVTLNRELQLIAGEFMEHQVQSDSHLSYLCQCAALNRGGLTPTTTVHIATHSTNVCYSSEKNRSHRPVETCLIFSVVDTRDGAKYTVQVVHSAALLLSMVLVYGREQRLLAMAHLIGADSLPSRDQLDSNLQFLPHLSNADERAFVIVNRDGDYAIVKGRWTGFSRKQPASKGQKAKPGSAGRLLVDAFNLLKNTVQKIEVPSPEGSTLFVIGVFFFQISDAQARLPGKRIECRSTNTAEQIASVFCVATLFVLCNPDKVGLFVDSSTTLDYDMLQVRSRNDSTSVGHQAHKWPLTLACGYGRQLPSTRVLQSQDAEGASLQGCLLGCANFFFLY